MCSFDFGVYMCRKPEVDRLIAYMFCPILCIYLFLYACVAKVNGIKQDLLDC